MRAYIEDPAVGRRALEASIVRNDNAYSTRRLRSYDRDHWGALPESHLATMPIGVPTNEGTSPRPPAWDDPKFHALDVASTAMDLTSLRALGERAFFEYPLDVAEGIPAALARPDHAGVWRHDGNYGAVWARLPNGIVASSLTCATCHASRSGDALVVGRNNPDVEVWRLYGNEVDAQWGRGRVDVTPDDIDNPVAITDLRPVRYQRHLHHAATLENEPVALAVRIETLIITSHGEALRPPRAIAAALAVFLLGLSEDSPLPRGRGADVFDARCAACHRGDGASGPPVSLSVVGTDRAVGESPDRGTGMYRVPSLRAVGDRKRLFASGAIEDIDALMRPERDVAGHRYGLDLDAAEREALIAYLRSL